MSDFGVRVCPLLTAAGDDPPRDRTKELRVLGFPSRRLGPVQMTTDTALGVNNSSISSTIGNQPELIVPDSCVGYQTGD